MEAYCASQSRCDWNGWNCILTGTLLLLDELWEDMPMNKIVAKEFLSENVVKLVVEAPQISQKQSPGQFVIVRTDDKGERIPLTIADADKKNGTITLIIQKVGTSSHKIASLDPGDSLLDVSGPLGRPTHIEKVGTVLACGGGVGIAPLYPIARAFKEAGNKLIAVLGARNRELLILEKEMAAFADEMIVMTDDGSYGKKGRDHGRDRGGAEARARSSGRGHRAGGDDEIRRPADQEIQCPDHRQPEHHHGGRDRHVRRLPGLGGRQDQVRLRGRSRIRRP